MSEQIKQLGWDYSGVCESLMAYTKQDAPNLTFSLLRTIEVQKMISIPACVFEGDASETYEGYHIWPNKPSHGEPPECHKHSAVRLWLCFCS